MIKRSSNSLIHRSSTPITSLNNYYQSIITLENTGIGDNDIISGLDFGSGWDGQTVLHRHYHIEVYSKPYRRYYKWLIDTLKFHSPLKGDRRL